MEPNGASDRGSQKKLSSAAYVGALVRATRPHFFALPIGAALAGVASAATSLSPYRLAAVCMIAAGGWGSGQIFNDLLDREADAIDAPDRPFVLGILPPRLTLAIALLAGLAMLLLLTLLSTSGLVLGASSMVMLLTYNKCKGVPLLGNLSHGILLATATLVGAAVALPEAGIGDLIDTSHSPLLFVGAWGAVYVQANYEKDARGDEAAGYRTLAHILGIRQSALLRALASLTLGGWWAVLGGLAPLRLLPAAAGLLVAASALATARENSPPAALRGYRAAVHGGTIGMLGFGASALPAWPFWCLVFGAGLLTEAAFRRSLNP